MTLFLGLTGSIGMGKTTTAQLFSEAGAPVYDADAAVHKIYARGGAAVGPVSDVFPAAIIDGAVDRPALRDIVLKDGQALEQLNMIVHPLVAQSQIQFRQQAVSIGAPVAILDIPLLFETGGDKACDYIAVVTAPAHIQHQRVMMRASITQEEFETILAKQTPDAEKRAAADFIISSAFGIGFAKAQVKIILDLMKTLTKEA